MSGSYDLGMPNRRVFIVHPYVQSYRRGLYERLSSTLRELGLELRVVANESPPSLRERNDSTSGAWSREVPSRWVSILGRDVAVRSLSELQPEAGDLFVLEQALKNLDTYPLLLRKQRSSFGVAMWGHGKTYSTYQHPVLRYAKNRLTQQAEWFFAYTYGGARYVNTHGFPASRTTVLNNTIDTATLLRDLTSVERASIEGFSRSLGLTPGRTCIFVGGIDERKGIDFLIAAASCVAEQLAGFTLLIGGAGRDMAKVQAAERSGAPIRYLGRLQGLDKALALKAADAMMIPQWIGLVAVDSLVSGRPIITTRHNSHSPESEYLIPGRNIIFTKHSVAEYANGIADLLCDTRRLNHMQMSSASDAHIFGLDDMVNRFAKGLQAWVRQRRLHRLP